MHKETEAITQLILDAAEKARQETSAEPEPVVTGGVEWPVECTVGPGLEGALACESQVGYVNGSKGWLIYRGYDIFELAAYSTYEEVSYLLLHGYLPSQRQLTQFCDQLRQFRHLPDVKRLLLGFPIEDMNTMAALRLGTNLMRQKQTYRDKKQSKPDIAAISADEDTDPMERYEAGSETATFEFRGKAHHRPKGVDEELIGAEDASSCYHLIAGVPSIAATILRVRNGHLPIEPLPDLGHAGNLIYMMTGRRPSPIEERIMDVALILHADHGMNASTFAAMVVASTLSDVYFATGSGIAALNGPLHGGANEQVLRILKQIGSVDKVEAWYKQARAEKRKIMGFGHRVYKAYDPRARILKPIAGYLALEHPECREIFSIAEKLEQLVVDSLGAEKGIFPNVDFYSGMVYAALGIPPEMFTPMFAVSRVAGWTARILEYLANNRIFRPRAVYTGPLDLRYTPLDER